MSADTSKQAQTIIDKIKQLLFNLELTIVYADGEIAVRRSTMKLYEGQTNRYKQRKFINAKVDEERFQIFKEDVENVKNEIMENLDIILSKYQARYKQIFVMRFFEEKTYQEIADETNYSLVAINRIVARLKNDLLTFYMP